MSQHAASDQHSSGISASLGHIGLHLSSAGEPFAFWKDLLQYLGFQILSEQADHFDTSDGRSYLCIGVTPPAHRAAGFHRRRTGLNHVAFRVESAALVDRFITEFLLPRAITPLYGGAKQYPDYAPGYYAVYFEDPDRIKVEVVYDTTV